MTNADALSILGFFEQALPDLAKNRVRAGFGIFWII
jgi:hypothetical protein